MKGSNKKILLYAVDRKQIKNIIFLFIFLIVSLSILAGILTSLDPKYRLYSHSIGEWTSDIQGESFSFVLAYENRYFGQVMSKETLPKNIGAIVFELATNISLDDPRSFLGRELPGFQFFDGRIVVAGEGTDYTNLPVESAPPKELLEKQNEATTTNVETNQKENISAIEDKKVFIYHTHNRESFLPHLEGVKNPNGAYHSEVNITLVGDRLAQEIEKRGIGALVDKSDVTTFLKQEGLQYWQSYKASRPLVEEAIQTNKLQYVIDLHRDSLPKEKTTVTINGTTYARIIFVIGGDHGGYEQNLHLAQTLHRQLDEKYPGLSRGVIQKRGKGVDGIYNQDLSSNSLLIEIGGYANSLEEMYVSTEALADVMSEHYFNQQNGQAQ